MARSAPVVLCCFYICFFLEAPKNGPGLKAEKVAAGKLTGAIKHRVHFSSDLQRYGGQRAIFLFRRGGRSTKATILCGLTGIATMLYKYV
jgi:hypothetical protein